MRLFKVNIAGKLTIPSTIGVVVILFLFTGIMMKTMGTVQQKQLDRTISILNKEKEKQDKLLRKNLNNYTRLIGEMLVLVAPERMMTLDYEALDQIALLAQKDPNISYIKFKDTSGNPLTTTENDSQTSGDDYTIHHDIVSWGEKLGEVEVGINQKQLIASIKDLDAATKELIRNEQNEKAKNIRYIVNISILFTAMTCLVSFVVIFLSTRLITGPLSVLLEGIQRIRDDDYSYKLDIKSADELGEVAKIFNLMRAKLQQTLTELREHQEHLEDKVTSRTKELQDKNEELNAVNRELHTAMQTIKSTQEDLLRAEKFAAVGQMSGILAHEVLNPITAISLRIDSNVNDSEKSIKVMDKLEELSSKIHGSLSSLADDVPELEVFAEETSLIRKIASALGHNQGERHEDLNFLKKQIERVMKILDGLRQMSKSSRTIETIQLDTLISEVIEDMSDSFKKRKIEIEPNLEAIPPMQADNMEIYSIVSNLIRNSVHAIDKQPNPDNPKNIYVNLYNIADNKVAIEVSDTGIGIPPENWEKIFEPDFTSKGREGTGLGLSYSRSIARGYNGDLEVKESEVGKGTTFLVVLGLAPIQMS